MITHVDTLYLETQTDLVQMLQEVEFQAESVRIAEFLFYFKCC